MLVWCFSFSIVFHIAGDDDCCLRLPESCSPFLCTVSQRYQRIVRVSRRAWRSSKAALGAVAHGSQRTVYLGSTATPPFCALKTGISFPIHVVAARSEWFLQGQLRRFYGVYPWLLKTVEDLKATK